MDDKTEYHQYVANHRNKEIEIFSFMPIGEYVRSLKIHLHSICSSLLKKCPALDPILIWSMPRTFKSCHLSWWCSWKCLGTGFSLISLNISVGSILAAARMFVCSWIRIQKFPGGHSYINQVTGACEIVYTPYRFTVDCMYNFVLSTSLRISEIFNPFHVYTDWAIAARAKPPFRA